jgi:hypothetical protein
MWHFRCKNCKVKVEENCHTCEVRRFLQDCQAAIDLIGWYLRDYHRANFGHREMLTQLESVVTAIQAAGEVDDTHRTVLRQIEQRVDSWLYQPI